MFNQHQDSSLSHKALVVMLGAMALPIVAFAHSYGPAPRRTTAPGDVPQACTQCHTTNALNSGSGSVKIVLQGGPVYLPGVKQRVTIQVADPAQQRWGFEFTSRLNSNPENGQAGDFIPVDNMTQVICEDNAPRPCASGVLFVTHTSAGSRNGTRNGVSFHFDWIPPATNAGPVTLWVAGNAANGDATPNGDQIYTASVELTPAIAAMPSITADKIVSAATLTAVPMPGNSWVTVYGTNLSPTTRGFTDTDFVDGAIPFALDGVSAILIQRGAPRLAYVGYVSPTQVNFLLPSDLGITPTTVQIKNPAGTTTDFPITVAAAGPQMYTADGKAVLGVHADGSSLSKTAPATPGETISIYAMGMGATNPPLVPGQLPVVAANLTTLPQVTIGGATATVLSAAVVPGAAGLYRINVQVPASAANGDLPVVVTVGTTASAAVTVTVQK